jgi:hypothetical protein
MHYYRVKGAAPLALLLDLDGTLVGEVAPMVAQHAIVSLASPGALPAMRRQVVSVLRNGVARRNLGGFCRAMAQSGIKLFVYTASDDAWAAFLVPCLEEAVQAKFQRPIFARSRCTLQAGEYKKSIAAVQASMARAMHVPSATLAGRVMLVDNTPSVLLRPNVEKEQLITCPTYDYVEWYDVLKPIPEDDVRRHAAAIRGILARAGAWPDSDGEGEGEGGHARFLHAYYASLAGLIKRHAAQNVRARARDRFLRGVGAFERA